MGDFKRERCLSLSIIPFNFCQLSCFPRRLVRTPVDPASVPNSPFSLGVTILATRRCQRLNEIPKIPRGFRAVQSTPESLLDRGKFNVSWQGKAYSMLNSVIAKRK